MVSICCSFRRSPMYRTDVHELFNKQAHLPFTALPSYPTKSTSLRNFNIRVTQHLRRYRLIKKQWLEIATSAQNISSVFPSYETLASVPDVLLHKPNAVKILIDPTQKSAVKPTINEDIDTTPVTQDYNHENSNESDPLYLKIRQDLINLRKSMKAKRRHFVNNTSFKRFTFHKTADKSPPIPTTVDDQNNNGTKISRKASSALYKLKPLDYVNILGNKIHHSTFSKTGSDDSGISCTTKSPSVSLQYSKQQQVKREYNSKLSKINHNESSPFPRTSCSAGFPMHSVPSISTRKPKMSSHPSIPTLPESSLIKKKQSSFIKQETSLPICRRSSNSGEMTTCSYTYAASSSSLTPNSTMTKRNKLLLPIVLQSSSCIGIQTRNIQLKTTEYDSGNQLEENNNEEYDHYPEYKRLINCLPKPVISIHRHYGQGDYEILFQQMHRIQETMPSSSIYDEFARTLPN